MNKTDRNPVMVRRDTRRANVRRRWSRVLWKRVGDGDQGAEVQRGWVPP